MRTGDTVLHRPSGETWTVAYVQGDYLAWCGWPPGEAKVSDCDLVESCSDEESEELLHKLAEMGLTDSGGVDARCSYARHVLASRAQPSVCSEAQP